MIKCPLCDLTTGHSHFSYDIAEYVDSLRKQLSIMRTNLENMKNNEEGYSVDDFMNIARHALEYAAEINRIGGMNG